MHRPRRRTARLAPSHLDDALRLSTHLYLAVGMVLLIGMLVASYMQASAGLDAMRQFALASQRAGHLDRMQILLLELQAINRGYALTRDPAYLAAYREKAAGIQTGLDLIRQNHLGHLEVETAGLIQRGQNIATRMDTSVTRIERGDVLDKKWFDEGTRAMEDYRREHNQMKAELLSENLENVQRSIKGFENARFSTVLLAIASLLLLIMSITQTQRKQELRDKIHRLLKARNERLESDVRSRTTELANLATYLTEVRETEKLHLARELHDELGALLTAAKLDADGIERALPPESRALVASRMARLRQSLISGITLKRRITNDLRPALLYDLGLVEALRALIAGFRETAEIEVRTELPEDEPRLSDAVSLSLFRIVQEALTNIGKYARARHVSVSLRLTSAMIELVVDDDGVGFDPESPKLARHGIAGIKHRVFTHGGQLHIRSAPGAGTTIRAVLPLEPRAASNKA